MKHKMKIIPALIILFLSACSVGPNYVRPATTVPTAYKEAAADWKIAQPQDTHNRGEWWKIFNDPDLNALETQLNGCNQTIAVAAAQYLQARAIVDEARASYFPTLTGTASIIRQKQVPLNANNNINTMAAAGPQTSHTLQLDALWEPDLWGNVRRNVEAKSAGAEASAAQLAAVRLSSQASLAQFYFQLRTLDAAQLLLDSSVRDYKKSLQLTKNRYTEGVAARADVVQAQSQLETAQAAAINNGIQRAQFEHAIAVLIGKPPALFSLPSVALTAEPPVIPVQVPSTLLERRPDVAVAERQVAQANAEIGVAIAAYFPTLTLSGSGSISHLGMGPWFNLPDFAWSVGPQLAETLFDGGLRQATTAAARANYAATVATYRQTVLAAFQDVEDNLAALRILQSEVDVQNRAARDAKRALQIVTNQYKAGTVAYTDVITAQVAAYTAEKNALDVAGLRMTAAVGLVKALGGGWHA